MVLHGICHYIPIVFHNNSLNRRDKAKTTRISMRLCRSGNFLGVLLMLITTNSGACRIRMTKNLTMLAKPRDGLIHNQLQ
jgi:hypothetical protein